MAYLYYITRNFSYEVGVHPETGVRGKYHHISGTKYKTREEVWKDCIHEELKAIWELDELNFMHYIFHDKDVDKGQPVSIHCHIFVQFKESVDQHYVKDMFDASSDKNCQNVKNAVQKARYLLHITNNAINDGKHIYQLSEVFSYGGDFREVIKEQFWRKAENAKTDDFKVTRREAEIIIAELGKKVEQGQLTVKEARQELENRAGYHYKRLETFEKDRALYIKNEVERLTKEGRKLNNIYIMGSGGIGKTTLANRLGFYFANGQGVYLSASLGKGKTPDALNHYTDEAVAVFNEMSANGWDIDEFTACFDPHTYAPFPSRNENKHFIGHTCIFTNSVPFVRFAKDLVIYSKGGSEYQASGNKRELNEHGLDKYWQVRRRFDTVLALQRDEVNSNLVHVGVFVRKGVHYTDGDHVLVGSVQFISEPNKEPVISDDTLAQLIELMKVDSETLSNNDVMTITDYIEKYNLDAPVFDDSIICFVEDVIEKATWELLPTKLLYSIYKNYMKRYFPSEKVISKKQLQETLEMCLTDWEYGRHRTDTRIMCDEPLIYEYNVEGEWHQINAYFKNTPFGSPKPPADRYWGFAKR